MGLRTKSQRRRGNNRKGKRFKHHFRDFTREAKFWDHLISHITTTKMGWGEESQWWKTSSYGITGNFLETSYWSVPPLRENLTVICEHSNRPVGWGMAVAFSKNSHPWELPRIPLKRVLRIRISVFISCSLTGGRGMKKHPWLLRSCWLWPISLPFFFIFPSCLLIHVSEKTVVAVCIGSAFGAGRRGRGNTRNTCLFIRKQRISNRACCRILILAAGQNCHVAILSG